MSKKDLIRASIELSPDNVIVIHHNMTVDGNINTLEAAIENWFFRTDEETAESLCKYIMEKAEKYGTGHLCYTEEQFKKLP